MHGIKNLKGALAFIINLSLAIDKRLDDGKLSFVEGITMIPDLIELPRIISEPKTLIDEYNDLDGNERSELMRFIESELDLRNDKVEEIIHKGFDALFTLIDVLDSIKTLKNEDRN